MTARKAEPQSLFAQSVWLCELDDTALVGELEKMTDPTLEEGALALEPFTDPRLSRVREAALLELTVRRSRVAVASAVSTSVMALIAAIDPGSGRKAFFAKGSFTPEDMANWLSGYLGPFALGVAGDTLWVYDGETGVFVPDAITWVVAPAMKASLGNAYSKARLALVQAHLEADCAGRRAVLPSDLHENESRIVCANGALDWRTGVLHPHDPALRATVAIPQAWDPNADCPEIDKALLGIFNGDRQMVDLMYMVYGTCLYSGRPIWQQAIALTGGGANGKSTVIDLIEGLLGPKNVAHVPPQEFDNSRFAAADLVCKLANLTGDVADDRFTRTGTFKGVIVGDTVRADVKFQKAFNFRPVATHIASFNTLPPTSDPTDGYFRRFLIVPLPLKFVGYEPVARHERRKIEGFADHLITSDAERAGLFRRAVEGLRKLMLEHNGSFPQPAAVKAAMAIYREDADPIRAFLNAGVIHRASASTFEPRMTVFRRFKDFLEQSGNPPYTGSARKFGTDLAAGALESATPFAIEEAQQPALRQSCLFGISFQPTCTICLRPLVDANGLPQTVEHIECAAPPLDIEGGFDA